MNQKNRILPFLAACFFVLLSIIFAKPAIAQQMAYQPKDPQLYKTIVHMDSLMFDAFNTHNLEVLKTLFAPNLEFYHDKGGLNGYDITINNFKSIFASTPDLRRELVPGTLEVYAIPGYGAVEIGEHKFIHIENGQTVTGLYKFIHTWQFKNNQWQVTRVVSVGH